MLENSGLKVSNLYIAQIKRKHGLEMGENYNHAKFEGARHPGDVGPARTGAKVETAKVPVCPPEKEKAIEDALRHFQMI